ncbi:MAG: phosphatase PAP2 family protein [Deltaproteobacteria bacterium]|nr:phosphatase PAP2 family protein [Deltaproteobacteria bacterium]
MIFRAVKTGLLLLLLTSTVAIANESRVNHPPEEKYVARSEKASHWFFEEMPRHLGHDLKETFISPVILVWLSGGAITSIASPQDDSWQQSLGPRHDPLGETTGFFNQVGQVYTLGGLALATYATGRLFHEDKLALLGEVLIESLLLTEVMTLTLKYTTQRERPDGSDSASFPSGHAAGSFAMATGITEIYGPWAGIPAYAVASLVALSRLDDNKHFASDVLFGATIGTAFAMGTGRFHKKEKPQFFITPQPVAGGWGIAVSRFFY